MNKRGISIGIITLLVILGLYGLLNFGTENVNSISGTIDTDTTWDLAGSPYYITGHLTVAENVNLTIEPGVVVMFTGLYYLLIQGNLSAIGNETHRINITSNQPTPAKQQWNKIEIDTIGHVEIKYCNISCATTAISLHSDKNNITNCNLWLNYYAIDLYSTWNNNISYNNIWENMYGIYGYNSRYNNITSNKIFSNIYSGIRFWSSADNIIKENDISNNLRGIYLWLSSTTNITNNNFINNGVFIDGGSSTSHDIPTDNIVNGKPLYYYKNNNSVNLNGIPVGQLILANCDNATLRNLKINKTDAGIEAINCWNITIKDCDLSRNNINGICLRSSSNATIENCDIMENKDYGIYFYSSSNNKLLSSNISYNERDGIRILFASNNNLTGNDFYQNGWDGISIDSCGSNTITYNNISCNYMNGIDLDECTEHVILNNSIQKNGIFMTGDDLSYFNSHIIPTNNLVNGKPVYYYKNTDYIVMDAIPVGQIILANCSDFSFMNLEIINTSPAMEIVYSTAIDIIGNNLSNSYRGIYFKEVTNSEIINNNVSWNMYGISLYSSSNNCIYHNNIINNSMQAYDDSGSNLWNDTYPKGGNYWSDYNGTDYFKGPNQDIPGQDYIGDSPYVIDGDSQDNYPLLKPSTHEPLENYTILKQGWNLISIPLIQGNQNINRVLEMIEGYYDAVQWHDITDTNDPWKHYKVGKPYGNDLSKLNESMGFWIHITQPGDTILLYNGTQPTVNQTIILHPGWNLVGYPSLSNKNRTEALNNISLPYEVDAIWTYNATTQNWDEIGPSDYFELGRGYWIHAKTTCVWEVPL